MGKYKRRKKKRKLACKSLESRLEWDKKHDAIVDEIAQRFNYLAVQVSKNYYYNLYGKNEGEIDLFVLRYHRPIRGIVAYVFEMKCTDSYKSRKKASHQLERNAFFLYQTLNIKKAYNFYVCGTKNGAPKIELYNIIRFDS